MARNILGLPVTKFDSNLLGSYSLEKDKSRKDFSAIIKRAAEEKAKVRGGYRCANPHCKQVYSERGLFDIGHLNGKKWDNRPENCGLLCRKCNVEQGNKSLHKLRALKERVGKNAEPKSARRATATKKPAKKKRKSARNSNPYAYDPNDLLGVRALRKQSSGFF